MARAFLLGMIIAFLRGKMQNGDSESDQYLFSFSYAEDSARGEKEIIKHTPIKRANTPKHMSYIFFLCQVILVTEEKGGVCHK